MSTTVLLVALALPVQAGERETIEAIAAVIESEVITVRELEEKARPFLSQLETMSDETKRARRRREIYQKVLDIEIGERMVKGELERNADKLGVTEQDVDRAVDEVLRMNNLTRDQLQAALYGQGMSWSDYRKKLREQIERARLIQFKVQGRVQVKEADVLRRCEQRRSDGAKEMEICASHILLVIPQGSTEAQIERLHARASQLQAELASGADFAAYALKHSDDKAAPDGNLGCFGRAEMVEPFEKAAYATDVGDVSAVVRSRFGFHIIKVTDRRAPATSSCDEAALGSFRNEIYQEELERQMNAWIKELRKKAFVDVRLE